MELKVWGKAEGKPFIVFPSSEGKFYQYEDEGMVSAVWDLIDGGKLQMYCIDSVDSSSWYNKSAHPADRQNRHSQYESYVLDEVVPFIRHHNKYEGGIGVTGVSWGAYHAVNILLKHPDVFDACVAQSGVYSLDFLIGDYVDSNTYFNDPCKYIADMSDDWILENLRNAKIILSCGGGNWEEESLRDTAYISNTLKGKGVDVWHDVWGHDMNQYVGEKGEGRLTGNSDWPTWRAQNPYHFHKMFEWIDGAQKN
jgi:esterase/lipase superfamily enzyme